MRYNVGMSKKFAAAVFFLISSLFSGAVFAQEISGAELSDALASRLKRQGFELEKKPLSSAWFAEFPYNIQIDFSAAQGQENGLSMILTMAQEDAWEKEKFVADLLAHFKAAFLPCNLKVVFTACDKPKIAGNEKMSGSEIFCKSVEGSQNSAGLVLEFNGGSKNVITPGSDGEISPYYLTRLLADSFDNNLCPFQIAGGMFLALYRLRALKTTPRLSSFLQKEIPAVALTLGERRDGYAQELNSIKDFFANVEPQKNAEWSRHYFPVVFFSERRWISEDLILLHIFSFMTLTLFILADFAFLFRRRSHRLVVLKARALLSNYLIFLTAALLALAFLFGQYVAKGFQSFVTQNPMLLFLAKLTPAFLFVSLFYPLELLRHKKIATYLYEYILSTSAILNIFIFSFIDISFFYLFAIEYILLALSRVFKRSAFLFLFLAFFTLPFLPLIYSILLYSNRELINGLIFCGAKENILLAFMLVPFNLLWLRILARMNIKSPSLKSLFLRYALAGVCAITFLAAFSFGAIYVMGKFFFRNAEPPKPLAQIVNAQKNERSTVTVFDTEYYGGKIRRVEINCDEPPERCEVFINGSNTNPVYFSVYESETRGRITQFLLPDKPPKSFSLQYTPDSSDSEIVVMTYFMQEKQAVKASHGSREICLRESFAFYASGGKITERRTKK